uniref:MBG domain-containing protein n=1 Tax=Pseudomonas aeruginosa TaxID=287 RepID=UPI001E62093F
LTGGLNRVAGENVGVYGINQGDLALNSGNYDLSYQGNNLTITKALLNVIADAKTKVYGDADPSLTYQVSGLKNGDTAGSVLNGGGLVRVSGENVGNYAIQQGGLGLVSGVGYNTPGNSSQGCNVSWVGPTDIQLGVEPYGGSVVVNYSC